MGSQPWEESSFADSSLLLRSILFAGLDHATASQVIAHLDEERWPAGAMIFEDNSAGETLYVIRKGRVRVSKTLENGQEHVLVEMGPGEFFGEMALIEDKPRSARVTTVTATLLFAISRQTFNTLIERYPQVAINILKEISARLRLRNHEQEVLLGEKQRLVEELAAKNQALEQALVELRRAMATVAEHERVKRDLEIARQIQQQMLPIAFPDVVGLELYATTVSSRWVGGDLYDTVRLDSRRVSLILGDVSGKGIPAAMQMTRLMGEVRACLSRRMEPAEVMQVLNTLLCQRNTSFTSFVTMQYVLLDLAERSMHFICAGHPPILVRHASGHIEELGVAPNIPLGIEEDFIYHTEERFLQPGDTLLLYSDGVYETRNEQGELWGFPRLIECFSSAPQQPRAVIETMQRALYRFRHNDVSPPHDDTTLLCARLT